jgi:hypothetical protein
MPGGAFAAPFHFPASIKAVGPRPRGNATAAPGGSAERRETLPSGLGVIMSGISGVRMRYLTKRRRSSGENSVGLRGPFFMA